MFYQTYTARRPPKSPPAVTECLRMLLHDVICSEYIPFHRRWGDRSAQHIFCPWWPWPSTRDFVGAKFYCLHALASSNYQIQIREKTLEFFSTVLPAPSLHHNTHTTSILWPFFWDHPGEPVPEENFWILWCKGRLTEANTPTIRLGATPSGLSSAHVHQPLLFTGRMPFLPPNQQCHSTAPSLHQTKYLIQITDSMAWYNIHSQISTASFCIIS